MLDLLLGSELSAHKCRYRSPLVMTRDHRGMTKRPPYSPPRLAPWLLAVGVTLIAITGAVGALVVLIGVSPSDP
ncbi:MAG: hypothetical protein QOG97_1397 [Acidimicrobiaceae bacterium]|nr:hypothetical protein [Acidimicrobiaceae bacterium]